MAKTAIEQNSKPGKKTEPAKGQKGAPGKGLASGRLIKFPKKIDGRLVELQKETGTPIVERVRRAVARDLSSGLPVLGFIPCGPLEPVLAEAERLVDPGNALAWIPGDYFLKAKGDSMAPKIEKGDLVLLRPDISPQNGEICAVQVYADENQEGPCDATLKKVFIDPDTGKATLKAINERYKPIVVDARRVCVVGVYRGAIIDG